MLNEQLKNRIDALVEAGRFQQAEQALQALVTAEPDCPVAYQKLGITYLRLEKYRSAEQCLLHAASLMPGEPGAFDGLAETYALLGNKAKAREAGRRALVLKDAATRFVAEPPREPPARPGGSRLIAFSLFGAHPRYCETAVMNVHRALDVFPGWTCRFYVDATVPPPVLARLRASGAQIVKLDGVRLQLPGTMWRFLALDDPDAQAVICRDADSLLNARDAGWVAEWLQSGLPFHVVRDFFSHTELILAGLFGVRGGVLAGLEGMMRQWLAASGPVVRWTDQYFLRNHLWPLARDTALTHDTWYGYGSRVVHGTAVCADMNDHVGANHSAGAMGIGLDHPDGSEVRWELIDAADKALCSYVSTVNDRQLLVNIPLTYSERIRTGALRVRWEVTQASAQATQTPTRTGVARVAN